MRGRRHPRNIHDAFVRRVFSRVDTVSILLRHVLPPRCIEYLHLDTLAQGSSAYAGVELDHEAVDHQGSTQGPSRRPRRRPCQSLLDVLELRALPLSRATRQRILSTKDEQALERCFRRALAAASLDEVFGPGEPLPASKRKAG